MDALSTLLQTVQLRTSVYATIQLRPPWGVGIPRDDTAAFHAIVSGRCWLELEDTREPIPLVGGDVVVLPHGDAHRFYDDPRSPIHVIDRRSGAAIAPPRARGEPHAADTNVVCGHLRFDDRSAAPLVALLPPVVVVRASEGGRAADWLEPILHAVALENLARAPGADAVVTKLSDVIVIQAIRAHLADLPLGTGGWLRALTDGQLGAALAMIHQQPATPWTVAQLAAQAGMSRSGFAQHFAELVGEAPLTYVTRWRMHHAQRLLRAGRRSIAEVAGDVGYRTEPAFSRAFKRWVGVPPGVFREQARAALGAARRVLAAPAARR